MLKVLICEQCQAGLAGVLKGVLVEEWGKRVAMR